MKKNILILMSSCLCFLFTGSQFTVLGQTPVEKKFSAEEVKEWNSASVAENSLSKLSTAEKNKAKDHAQALLAYVVKAVLHRTDPAKYQVDESEDSPQAFALAAIRDVSAPAFKRMKDRAALLMTDAAKRSAVLGKFKDLDFRKRSIHADIKKISPVNAKPSLMAKDKDEASLQPRLESYFSGVGGSGGVVESLPAFNKLDLVLRKVHCVDETNPEDPGDDDMIVGGIIIGCSGNVVKARSIVSCHFDDNQFCDHGAIPMGTYNLGSCSGYPKTFYAILQLIEADSDEQEAAQVLSEVMGMAAAALAGTGYGAALAFVAGAVEVFSAFLFDDDAFHPYGVPFTLTSQNHFGADGRSNNWATGNISDHGGTYRIGFYWQLKN